MYYILLIVDYCLVEIKSVERNMVSEVGSLQMRK